MFKKKDKEQKQNLNTNHRDETAKNNDIEIIDLRSDEDRQRDTVAASALQHGDEEIAELIAALVLFSFDAYDLEHGRERLKTVVSEKRADLKNRFDIDVETSMDAEKTLRRIGMKIGEQGGDKRMQILGRRACNLGVGGVSNQLEKCWSGICGWYNGYVTFWKKHGL